VKIELATHRKQTVFNLRRWAELLDDPELARIEGRIETDRHGHVILNSLFAPSHGSYQVDIGSLIEELIPNKGRVVIVCPISTADGVKAADVAWASPECIRNLGDRACFPYAPEICVEVLLRGNTQTEIEEKRALYFDAGAKEVWVCKESGAMYFYEAGSNRLMKNSLLCPAFPKRVKLG
jgi:Uma2 family endonuclease